MLFNFYSRVTTVRLGEYNVGTDPDCVERDEGDFECSNVTVVAVEEKIVHEDYNPYDQNQYHDIALLRLAQDVTYTGEFNFNYIKKALNQRTFLWQSCLDLLKLRVCNFLLNLVESFR